MAQQTFRPSFKFTRLVYLVTLFLIGAAWWGYFRHFAEQPRWLLAIPALLLLIPLRMHLRLMAVKLMLDDDHLVMETGILSKTTRTLNVGKVQDVTVSQSAGQRMMGLGDISVETAGEGSAMTAQDFDRPKAIADLILKAAQSQAARRKPGA
jgi:uncharacterized membrane protein YdbT with pleckstrin-like domain